MKENDVYERLAEHLSRLGMGYPPTETLVEILKANLAPREAEAALAIPDRVIPLQPVGIEQIGKGVQIPREELGEILEGLSKRGLVFSGRMEGGERGYALQQVGFSFPQTFFWKGKDTEHARKMAGLVAKYFNRKVTEEAYSSETLPYRYIPVSGTLEASMQAVYPHHTMESVLEKATSFAVCHCACRMVAALRGRPCEHPTEVCLKFDELARYVIERGLGREISREEAREIIRAVEEAGMVHFVDNASGEIKHNCNCCGCACWNVGNIRRRKIPRDAIMATYFLRTTDEEACTGCGECVEICPVEALDMQDGVPVVDGEWCIGCGVCATACPADAVRLELRADRRAELPASGFRELHEMILEEKGLKGEAEKTVAGRQKTEGKTR
ncbi:MAG: 4Fe-4S binding protein [Deltaproteobacteria bacterium]|nr:4Fe-4S binding protein [Deltaproteobacteria bacterium]